MSWSKDERGGPRGYHHGNLKEALLRAALELIAQKGPAGFTFAEAARWAGVSPAAPYRHFRDRYELLASVALRGFEHFAIVLEQAWDDGRPQPFAALDRLGKAYLEFARTEPAYYSAMFEAGIPLATSPELREAGERAFAILRGASERLCAQMPPQSRPWSRCIFGPCHTALPRADDLRLLGLVALGPRHPRFHNREWTNGLLESQRHEPLAGQDALKGGLVGSYRSLKR